MNTNFHKHILNLFLCAFALIVLSACGGSGGGGGTPTAKKCTTNCGGEMMPPPPIDATAAYPVPNLATESPTAIDPDTGAAYTTWEAAIMDIQTNEYKAMGSADQIGAAYAYIRGHTGNGVIVSSMGGAIASIHDDFIGRLVNSGSGTPILGYKADGTDNEAGNAGTCNGGTIACTNIEATNQATHLAGIIVARKEDNFGIQGIAYEAKIKPIDIFSGTVDNTELIAAIGAASGSIITVMNNGWDVSGGSQYDKDDNPATTADNYHYETINDPITIMTDEKTAWKTAVKTTVVVFPAGDYGHNSINGMVKLYDDVARGDDDFVEEAAWKDINRVNINLASSHARLASTVTMGAEADLKGKTLTVIALDENNEIWEYSNGCGDVKLYCLGAPGVNINSAVATSRTPVPMTGTAQAAAHVSGAIAVVASSLPAVVAIDASPGVDAMTIEEAREQRVKDLVAIILGTADRLGTAGVDAMGNTIPDDVYGYGALNLARATQPIGGLDIMATSLSGTLGEGITLDNSGITLPTSFGGALDGFTVGFTDDYNRAYIGNPARISRENAAFTLGDTIATWESPELQTIALDSNSKMQFTNYEEHEDAKDTLIFTHHLPNHTIGFSYNEESKTPDLRLTDTGDDLHFQKILPIANDLMQLHATHKLGKAWNVKNAITSGEFDTGNRFNEAMANLNYTGENRNLTIGAGSLQEYGQFLGASGTGAYQLSDATQSTVTHLAISQNLPRNSSVKLKYTGFKTEVDMRYSNFAKINDLTADEYQLSLTKRKILGKNDSLNIELIQPFAVTDGKLQQSTVLGYNANGDYNNVTQNYDLTPAKRRQQLRMTWQNQINRKSETKLFISMQYENHVNNLRDNEDSQILGGISTRF